MGEDGHICREGGDMNMILKGILWLIKDDGGD